jgi:hypothetical protein
MKKWFWVMISMGCAVALFFGCNTVTNLDNDPAFKPMIGKVLMTKKDLVVMDMKGSKKVLALDLPGTAGVPELKDIPAQLPADYYDAVVHGVFPAGSTIQIVHIEHMKSFEFSFTDFYAIAISEGKFKGQKVDIGQLTHQLTRIPTFDAEYVEEVPAPTE